MILKIICQVENMNIVDTITIRAEGQQTTFFHQNSFGYQA